MQLFAKFLKIFISKMGRAIFTKFSIFVGAGHRHNMTSENWGSAPNFGGEGGANFWIGPRLAPPGGQTVLSGPTLFRPFAWGRAPLQNVPRRESLPLKLFPPRAAKRGLIFEIAIFLWFFGGPPAHRRYSRGDLSSAFRSARWIALTGRI